MVNDGLKTYSHTQAIGLALSKCNRITSLLHTSALFHDKFEEKYGAQGIPAPVPTRWNSSYRQVCTRCLHLLRSCTFLCTCVKVQCAAMLYQTVFPDNKSHQIINILIYWIHLFVITH